MRLTGTRTYYRPTPPKMPPGLVELMEGLTKEVLKNNPTDIYSFCASHMEQLLEKRDGPSRKKILSLEDKIKRAQEKVRQMAEKRRHEYDKNMLSQIQTNDVPNIAQETPFIIDKNNESLLQDGQNIVQTPIHHKLSIDNFSEVEISQESESVSANITTQIEKLKESENNTLTDVKINRNDMIVRDTNDYIVHSNNEVKEIIQEISQNNTPDTVVLNEPVVHFEIKQSADLDSDIPSDRSVVNEQSKENVNGDVSKQKENSKPVLVTVSTPDTTENILKDEEHKIEHDHNTIKIMAEDHNKKFENSKNLDTSDVQKLGDVTTIHESIQPSQIPTFTYLPPDTVNKDSNSIKQTNSEIQNINSAQDFENIQLPTHFENIELSDDARYISDNSLQGTNSGIVPDSIIDNNNLEEKANQNSIDNKKTNEPLQIIETLTNFSLPTPDIDNDIQTLMTENTLGEAQQSYELNNDNISIKEIDTPLEISEINKDPINSYEVTSNSVNLYNVKENSANAVANISSNSHNDDTDDGKVEILTDVSDNTPTDDRGDNAMNLETAAVTIQKVFRNFLFKSRGSTLEDAVNDEENFLDGDDKNKEECDFPIASALNMDRRTHGITRMDTVLQTVNEEKSLSLSDDSSTLSSAATIIQAHVRGFLVRNKLNSNKTVSTNSLATSTSNEPSTTSLDIENDHNKIKTVLNIHIGADNYLSRDESLITSTELSLDSPPSSINLHPLGYDKSERRKQLKREDAIQSISPPSNNSGKLSEDIESIKGSSLNDQDIVGNIVADNNITKGGLVLVKENDMNKLVETDSLQTAKANEDIGENTKKNSDSAPTLLEQKRESFTKMNSDEMDVITPFITNDTALIHSGEFHDAVLPTRVSRSDTSVVREFKNVLVYFLMWNHT